MNSSLLRRWFAEGGAQSVGPLTKALVVMHPDAPVAVHLNAEASLVADARVTRALDEGEAVTAADIADIEGLRPEVVDADAAWVALVFLPDGRQFASFDFRRNRGKALRLLVLGEQYLATSRAAHQLEFAGPTLDTAFSAAELAVMAMMLLTDVEPVRRRRGKHHHRVQWLRAHTRLGNAPAQSGEALTRLSNLRAGARYGQPAVEVDHEELEALLSAVEELLGHARHRVGELPPELP